MNGMFSFQTIAKNPSKQIGIQKISKELKRCLTPIKRIKKPWKMPEKRGRKKKKYETVVLYKRVPKEIQDELVNYVNEKVKEYESNFKK
jgi:hypothetical protein